MMKFDIVFSGVGGQGIVVASDIFCKAALLEGFCVAKSEIHGIAKRGGSIDAHVRVGDEVPCPMIERGTADLILGFELMETVRVLSMLKPEGAIVVNTKFVPPAYTVKAISGLPNRSDLTKALLEKTPYVHEVDANALAIKAGNNSLISTVMLGTLIASTDCRVSEKSIKHALSERFTTKNLDANLKALQLGAESVKV